MMRKTIPHEPQFALLYILLDRIECLVLGNLLLGIRPPRDLDNHIENLGTRCRRRRQKRDIMPCRHGDAVLFKVDAVLEGVWCAYRESQSNGSRSHGIPNGG